MSPGLRLQGGLFVALAMALVIAGFNRMALSPVHELWLAAALVATLGMPHGALDVLFARKLFNVSGWLGWAVFCAGYVGLAAMVVAVWAISPTWFLWGFLLGSALHFGGDPGAGTSRIARLLYGGAIIVLPAWMHGVELQRLLGMVAGPAAAAAVAPVLALVALPWLGATAVACGLLARRSRLAALELGALAALAAAAPPLVSFTVYFCAMHSPRHILRTLGRLTAVEMRQALVMARWPALVVFAALAVCAGLATQVAPGWQWSDTSAQTWVMQLVFVGLAALTLPHMALLEWARRAEPPPHS